MTLSWIEKWSAKVLSQGPIPHHVALILDGNRRWAKIKNIPMKDAHQTGNLVFQHLAHYLHTIGVHEVTGYVFSLDNFSRTKEEVDMLMQLFEDQIDKFIYKTHGTVRYRFMGQISKLPESLKEKCVKLEALTQNNPKEKLLNLAIAYTSQDDITQAIRSVLGQDCDSQEVSVDLLEQNMFFGASSKVDLLIRTSGETRLSNFMMWEVRIHLLSNI